MSKSPPEDTSHRLPETDRFSMQPNSNQNVQVGLQYKLPFESNYVFRFLKDSRKYAVIARGSHCQQPTGKLGLGAPTLLQGSSQHWNAANYDPRDRAPRYRADRN